MRSVLLVCALAWCGDTGVPNKARIAITKAHLKLLHDATRQFQVDLGRLPTEEEALRALIDRPMDWPDGVPWESYLDTPELPPDAWGNELVYVLDANLPVGFGIYSPGKDGVTSSRGNDPDDFNTWNIHSPAVAYYQDQRGPDWARAILVYLLLLGGIALVLWETSRIEKYLKRRRAGDS